MKLPKTDKKSHNYNTNTWLGICPCDYIHIYEQNIHTRTKLRINAKKATVPFGSCCNDKVVNLFIYDKILCCEIWISEMFLVRMRWKIIANH
jgi:hypothetical protein